MRILNTCVRFAKRRTQLKVLWECTQIACMKKQNGRNATTVTIKQRHITFWTLTWEANIMEWRLFVTNVISPPNTMCGIYVFVSSCKCYSRLVNVCHGFVPSCFCYFCHSNVLHAHACHAIVCHAIVTSCKCLSCKRDHVNERHTSASSRVPRWLLGWLGSILLTLRKIEIWFCSILRMSRKRMLEFEGGGHSTGRVTELLAKKISVGESRRGGRGWQSCLFGCWDKREAQERDSKMVFGV